MYFKFYFKLVVTIILSAALVIMAVLALVGDEVSLRVRSAEIYDELVLSETPLVINVNTASVRELQKLNGIGEATAKAIIAYREEHGCFSSVEELINVRGIGQATLEKILPYIIL